MALYRGNHDEVITGCLFDIDTGSVVSKQGELVFLGGDFSNYKCVTNNFGSQMIVHVCALEHNLYDDIVENLPDAADRFRNLLKIRNPRFG